MVIESTANPWVKRMKSLEKRAVREEEGLFVAEGIRFLSELPLDWPVEALIYAASYYEANGPLPGREKTQCLVFADNLFEKVSGTRTPQGVLALCRQKKWELETVLEQPEGLFLLAENVQDPGNLGTILRTADACGAAGVLLSKGCVDLYSPKVLRATMGAIFHFPIVQNLEICDMIKLCRKHRIPVFAADLEGGSPYRTDLRPPVAILVGNEANGLSREARTKADGRLTLPMPGRAESLNVAVAAAVLLYESVRQTTTKE